MTDAPASVSEAAQAVFEAGKTLDHTREQLTIFNRWAEMDRRTFATGSVSFQLDDDLKAALRAKLARNIIAARRVFEDARKDLDAAARSERDAEGAA